MEQLVNFIIRPPRAEYDPKNDLLDEEFMLKGKWYQRKDLEVKNSRDEVLKCSHYIPLIRPEGKPLPCVVYCHGNSGCRADASEAAIILLPLNITVFTLDFSGSGLSGGEHVTLGWNEKDDLRAVVEYLRTDGNVSLIGLWGRSMGAVTSLMYGAEDPSIAGMVLDSPFSDLVDLMMELVDTYKIRLPKFTVKFAIQYMRRAVLKKAKFDITELNTIKVAKSCFVPVLLGHAVDDDFIQPHHSDRVFEAYMGDKNIIKFDGDHNSPRPQFYFDSISIFFNNVLQPPEDEAGAAFFDMPQDYFGKGSWSTVHELDFMDDVHNVAAAPTSSTEDVINQVRSKRPMSRTEVPSDISAHNQTEYQEEGTGTCSAPSSSKMISFEFSNGDPFGPNVPASIDDDDYVEYPLDNMADFPSNVDEEERMLMKAVLESLKDLEVKPPAEQVSSNAVKELPQTLQDTREESSTVKQCTPSKEISASAIVVNGHDSGAKVQVPDTEKVSVTPAKSISAVKEVECNGASHRETSVSNQSSSSIDPVDGTKATVTVVKNPTSNVMDGLRRRWDLNFFKNR
ncbi:putative glutamine synthetase, chloroplastic-like isoform X1 [Capsicum annuum]|uniref:Serine aminopeptidase S33 domain-containing protein n=1 Tax=Capsicum annuum TaxID=4072 RepID=A0A2G3AL22_CAPAN|nr:uncharacterized protein LOC107856193 [Capsicum annuum]XP_047254895.1 uncharacterized protein LOC107856193 [Capsicum annuum]KAF3632981.1 putative glutamine synthetase, chloroplastic-like isoform X1 [Capsicum annuum]PHT94931.1 hypothetical protein T459_02813 [Capsicum annuum]